MSRFSISPILRFGTAGGIVGAMLALTASIEGCSAILGDFSVGRESDASTGSPAGDGGTIGDSAIAEGAAIGAHPDAAVSDGSDGGPTGKGSGDGAPATGTGSEGGPGDGGGDACAPGSTQCADGGVQDCVDGTWTVPVPCTNSVCSMGRCSGTCTPNTAQCSGNSVQRCDSTGHLGTPGPCVSQACVGGACQGVCIPGSTRCLDGGAEACAADGSWGTPVVCGAHQACTGGGATPASCACQTNACTGPGTVCTDSMDLASCMQDGQGCWYPSAPSACTNGACFGSPGSASCCTDQCTANATKCGGAGVQTCQTQGNGCRAYNAGTACGAHQTCTGSAPSAACTCTADPTCTSASNVCTSNTLTTCAQDSKGCFYAANTASCGTHGTCTASNMCACQSGYTSCSGACVNIDTDNNNCGACGVVCPTLAAPNSGSTCQAQKCIGYVGGAVAVTSGTTQAASNPDGMSIFAVKATMPAVAGTFVSFGAVVGSTSPSPGATYVYFGLYTNSGGMPDALIIDTQNAAATFNDPSSLQAVQSGGYFVDQAGFTGALPANATYWISLKTSEASGDFAGVSTAPCVGGQWINVMPPISWAYASPAVACVAPYQVYLVVSFP